ncbi:MAG: rhomboid family intramembrane serine protease [Frankia sp.]
MVLPIHDINPLARRPYVTWALIAVNVVVFVFFEPVVTSIGGIQTAKPRTVCEQQRFFDHWAAIPKELLSNRATQVVPSGQVVPTATGQLACVAQEPPSFTKIPFLSVLTSMFLHGSWLHLLGNMLFLGVFGNNIEDRMGRLRYLGFYLLCGYVATYSFALFEGNSPTTLIGASGAIAGVLGSYIVIFPRAKVIGVLTFLFFLPFWLPAWIVLGSWFLLQYLYVSGVGVADGGSVAYGAHVAGFLFGLLLTLPFVKRLRAAGPDHHPGPPSHPWIRHLRLPSGPSTAAGRHSAPRGDVFRSRPGPGQD